MHVPCRAPAHLLALGTAHSHPRRDAVACMNAGKRLDVCSHGPALSLCVWKTASSESGPTAWCISPLVRTCTHAVSSEIRLLLQVNGVVLRV